LAAARTSIALRSAAGLRRRRFCIIGALICRAGTAHPGVAVAGASSTERVSAKADVANVTRYGRSPTAFTAAKRRQAKHVSAIKPATLSRLDDPGRQSVIGLKLGYDALLRPAYAPAHPVGRPVRSFTQIALARFPSARI
jgi:hypothetical protein